MIKYNVSQVAGHEHPNPIVDTYRTIMYIAGTELICNTLYM